MAWPKPAAAARVGQHLLRARSVSVSKMRAILCRTKQRTATAATMSLALSCLEDEMVAFRHPCMEDCHLGSRRGSRGIPGSPSGVGEADGEDSGQMEALSSASGME